MFNKRIIKGQYVVFESPEEVKELEKNISEDLAQKIIEEAELKAKEIIEKANEEAENIINQAHLAYAEEIEKARKEGQELAQKDINNLIEQYSVQFNMMLENFNNSINLEIYNTRILLFNILKLLVRKFLNIEIFSSPKWVENSLNKILERFSNFDYIKIHVSSNIMKDFPDILEKFKSVDNIEILEDITLPDFSITVKTNMGNVAINKEDILEQINKIIEEELKDVE
ncbi:hypothetical protein [Marinitoga sp. 38H-ov]|uniref:hypothetical protein n=1 Tax=Marinitoga sp. 38H-ov TaxID=1755814 RepID=UPI0013EB5D7C|nr:hypothetical protein [Marinitoga sp. 38H-ov]KAF2956790.1 hypothetical protein AS160_04285 [Marinitoga sp. 38H-ov]